MDKSPLHRVKEFTVESYEQYMLSDAGREHYPFLNYMSASYGDCRHITDIGTRYVASSLAIGSNLKTPVWTFDIPLSTERQAAFRGKSEEEWQKQVQDVGVNVKFHNLDLLKVSKEDTYEHILEPFSSCWIRSMNLTLNHLNASSFRGCLILATKTYWVSMIFTLILKWKGGGKSCKMVLNWVATRHMTLLRLDISVELEL